MIEILNFVFASFWTWAGSVVLISAASIGMAYGVTAAVSVFRR